MFCVQFYICIYINFYIKLFYTDIYVFELKLKCKNLKLKSLFFMYPESKKEKYRIYTSMWRKQQRRYNNIEKDFNVPVAADRCFLNCNWEQYPYTLTVGVLFNGMTWMHKSGLSIIMAIMKIWFGNGFIIVMHVANMIWLQKSTNCNMHGNILMCKMTAMISDAGEEFLCNFCSLEYYW